MLPFLFSFSLKLCAWAKIPAQKLFLGLGFILRKKALFFTACLAFFCEQAASSNVFFADPRALQKLTGYLVEDEDKAYLSLKEACEKDKEPAEECCSSPKRCAGLAMDLVKGVGPLLPALFSAL